MGLIQINRALRQIKNKVKEVTNGTIRILDNEIELDVDGMPSSILIHFKGAVTFEKKYKSHFKTHLGKNVLLINNLFKKKFPKIILKYYGDLEIISCNIINIGGNSVDVVVQNKNLQNKINYQDTNLEDDSLVLIDSPKHGRDFPLTRGVIKKTPSLFDIKNLGKGEKNPPSSIKLDVKEYSISENTKTSPTKQQTARPAPSVVSQDVPKHSIADKLREASFAKGEKAPKDKGGY